MDASLTSHVEPDASSEVNDCGHSLFRRIQGNECRIPLLDNVQSCLKNSVVYADSIDYQLGAPSLWLTIQNSIRGGMLVVLHFQRENSHRGNHGPTSG